MDKRQLIKQIKDITKKEAVEDFKNLKNVDPKTINFKSKIGSLFVDYFTFNERINTKGNKNINFFDFYKRKDEFIKKNYIKKTFDFNKKHGITNEVKNFYKLFNLYFGSINIFKPLLAYYIYSLFNPKSVLDMTMGWGGRLVGACAYDVPNYIGIDLNKNLKKPYEKMVTKLKELGSKTNIKLFFEDALKVDYSKLTYDMVFSSPPYFNLEIYTGTEKRTKQEWIDNFYKPLFIKTFEHLQNNGVYILNIPIEIYKDVCIPLFGKADKKIPLVILKRGSSTNTKGEEVEIKYKEFIYCWFKNI